MNKSSSLINGAKVMKDSTRIKNSVLCIHWGAILHGKGEVVKIDWIGNRSGPRDGPVGQNSEMTLTRQSAPLALTSRYIFFIECSN